MSQESLHLGAQDTPLTLTSTGEGRPVLVLHGGGGPAPVAGFVQALSRRAHVLAPIHPGFAGTMRPPHLSAMTQLAALYADLLAERGLSDVLVIGFSMGGWVAAELALGPARQRLGGLVLVNAIGVAVQGEPVADVLSLSPRELAERSFSDPDTYFVDPATLPPERIAMMEANFRTLAAYCGPHEMADPTLMDRLASLDLPSLVVWGENDRIATPTYGRAYAAALPGARFELIPGCGHMPQIEQPARLLALIEEFEGLAPGGGRHPSVQDA